MRPRLLLALTTISALAASGCAGLRLGLIDASVKRPSNIAVYFTVDTTDDQPVPSLTAEQFRIYEDGQPISIHESKQTILNPEVAAAHHTLLLIDMSGSVTASGDVGVIQEAARAFAERVQKHQKVAIYAFDGSTQIHPLVGFGSGGAVANGAARLGSYKARDPSTNLNGAVLEGMKLLRRQMTTSAAPLTFGTLVVFTDGTDRAHRVKREQLEREVYETDLDVFVIGVGAEIDESSLRRIGKTGTILTKDRTQIAASFQAAAARVEASSKHYYLLGYCSPARAGKHELRVAATFQGKTGDLAYEFDATGFGPNCDPTARPTFNVRRPKAKGTAK
jgi:uncharacterized protein YegL